MSTAWAILNARNDPVPNLMTRVAHLLDESAGWEQRVGLTQLLDRLSCDRFEQHAATLSPKTSFAVDGTRPVERLPCLPWPAALRAPIVAQVTRKNGIDLMHAWGVSAALAARAAGKLPLVVQLFDPIVASSAAAKLRSIARDKHFAVVCSCEIVRRKLVEGGLQPEVSVVIRPGVDFGLINRGRRENLRGRLGIDARDFVVIVPEPVSRSNGSLDAAYGAMVHSQLSGGNARVVLPGRSREVTRIKRFAHGLPIAAPIVTPKGVDFEQLVSVADLLLVTPRVDTSTTAIAWAMASGAVVIATATYAVTELIASKVNGLLFKQVPGRSMLPAILQKLADQPAQNQVREAARGQAYQVFGLRRYVEQIQKLYDNVLSGRPPGEEIVDSAIEV